MRNKQNNKKYFAATVLILPSLILFTLILIVPIIQTGYLSMVRWNGIGEKTFTGLGNFTYLFTRDRNFFTVIKNTIIAPILCNVIQIPIALALAYLVYRTKRAFRLFQTVYFIPVILSAAIMGLMFSLFFNREIGPLVTMLNLIGIKNPPIFLSDANVVLYTVLAPAIWQYIGYFFVILLAGMQAVPTSILESASVDGANSVNVFFRIMVPSLKDIIGVCIILNTIGALKSFDLSFIMTAGGPGVRSSFLTVYLYKLAVSQQQYGRASAVAVILIIISFTFTLIINKLFAAKK